MKCDRRWWNDGRLEREQAACVQLTAGYTAWRVAYGHVAYAELDAPLDALWLRAMVGDPTGQPWHEVLAAWTPSSAGTFFGVRRP
jgi:hypothetical protein